MIGTQFMESGGNRKGAIGLGLTFLIFIVIAIVVMIILSSAMRSYVIGGLNFFGSIIGKIGGQTGSVGTEKTAFVAYQCTLSGCSKFQNVTPYNSSFWYVYFNGQNLSMTLPSAIYFTSVQGNYSFVVYNITTGNLLLCSNLSFHSGSTVAGEANVIYYSQNYCP